jgi:hypothetical protein
MHHPLLAAVGLAPLLSCALLFASEDKPDKPAAKSAEHALAGRWKVLVRRDGTERDYYLELAQDGKKVSGKFHSPRSGDYQIQEGSFDGGALRVVVPRRFEDTEIVFTIEAKLHDDGELRGRLLINGEERAEVTLTREKPAKARRTLAGKWSVTSKSPDGAEEYHSTLNVTESPDGGLAGKYESRLGVDEIAGAKVDGDKVSFEVTLTIDANDVTFIVRAEFKDADTLAGKWELKDNEELNGEWSAKRERPSAAAREPAAGAPAEAKEDASSPFAGRWYARARMPSGEELRFVVDFTVFAGGKLSGSIRTRDDRTARFENGSIDAHGVRYTVEWEQDGERHAVEVRGELDNHGLLRGKWAGGGDDGEWSARRAEVF